MRGFFFEAKVNSQSAPDHAVKDAVGYSLLQLPAIFAVHL